MAHFIPEFHFDDPASKLTSEWCIKAKNYYFDNTHNRNLLEGKDVAEIDAYAAGKFDMRPFQRMFKSMKRAMDNAPKQIDGSIDTRHLSHVELHSLDWKPLALIPNKLNSAVSIVFKIPVEPECKATDALAMKKRDEDITFLENKPTLEAELQPIADDLNVGKVDLGTTKHSARKFSDAPMGLDLRQPDEKDIFANMLYSLRVETAFEQGLKQFGDIKRINHMRRLETTDTFKYGVCSHRGFTSSMTGLPDAEYLHPGAIQAPISKLPDFSDNTHRIIHYSKNVLEFFNYFSDEIKDMDTLNEIINGKETGYCACNGGGTQNNKNWGSFKVELIYMEVKTVDWIGINEKAKSKRGVRTFTNDPEIATKKIWGQNTIGFWWLRNTKYCFGIHRLDYAHRTKGKESFQNFSTNIYKSQDVSAIELSIGENKKAQIADIKLQHAILKSLPAGKYIDLRFLRNAMLGLKNEQNKYTMQDLIDLAFEQNILIGDTEGFEGKNDGQLKPMHEIAGGLKSEIGGYISTILSADQNISMLTGINQQLTGQSANPEGLVGMQKLMINSSINAIDYCNQAVKSQYEGLFNLWANLLQYAIAKGGKVRQAMVNFIGIDDVELLKGLNEAPIHNLTIKIDIKQREEERQRFQEKMFMLIANGIINSADEYLLSAIQNPKERFAYLAVKENKWKKEQDRIRQEGYQQQQSLLQQQGQQMMQAKQADTEKELNSIYAKGDVNANLLKLADSMQLNKDQFLMLQKRLLQKERGDQQTDKAIRTIHEKTNAEAQTALTA